MKPTNLLVIKLRYIGDVLLATPMIRALRRAFPKARLTMAVNHGTEDLLRWNPDLDEVITVDRHGWPQEWRFLRDVRQRGFDCVIDLTDADRSALIAFASRAAVRIGFNDEHRWRGLLYTDVVKSPSLVRHRIERNFEALRAFGLEPDDGRLLLRTSPQDEDAATALLHEVGVADTTDQPLVMLQPGARWWFKAWPPERFAELADRLVDSVRCRILIGGDAKEQALAEQIRRQCRCIPAVLAGRTSLLVYAAVLKRCALFVGNDNGPMHMAAAVGTPVVGLFGPSNPAEWGPRGVPHEILYKGLDCRACFHPSCHRGELNCMRQISVAEVLQSAKRLLKTRVRR